MKLNKRICLLLVSVLLLGLCSYGIFAAPKQIKLSLWGGYPEMAPFYTKVIEDYQKLNPNVQITFLTHPLREHEQKLSAAIPSNSAADILETSPYVMRKFIDAGFMDPNPKDIEKWMKSGIYDQFYLDEATINKRLYGVPFFQGRQVLFYNVDMFKEAGLPGPPKTWEELITYAQKLAKYDTNGNLTRAGISLRKSGGGSGVAEKWWFWLYPAGGSIITEVSPGKYRNNYDNDAGRAALKLYSDLLYKYKVDSHKVKADSEGFALETCAMFTRESWVVGFMKENAPKVKFDAAPLPANKRAGTICTLVNFYVAKNSKNPKEAWKFIQFMMKPEYQKFLLSRVGWFPCSSADYEPIYQEVPQYRAFMDLPEGFNLYGYPSLACYDEIQTKLAERLIKAFMDESLVDNPTKLAKVIADAAAETDAILKENGIYAD